MRRGNVSRNSTTHRDKRVSMETSVDPTHSMKHPPPPPLPHQDIDRWLADQQFAALLKYQQQSPICPIERHTMTH